MTVRNRRTKRDAKIKQYLLGGYTLASIAKFTKISPTRVGQIRNLLLESGELVEIPHTNPRAYADPHAHALGSELLENDGGVEMNGLTRDGSQVRDVSHIRDSHDAQRQIADGHGQRSHQRQDKHDRPQEG